MAEPLEAQVFQNSGSAGFEIAFTALLCTYITQLPETDPITNTIFLACVLALIMIALLRMMATVSSYRSSNRVIGPTQTILEGISFAAIIYGIEILISTTNIPLLMIYSFLILSPIFFIVAHEILFGDLLIYYAAVAFDAHSNIKELEINSEYWKSIKSRVTLFLESMMRQILVLSHAEIPPRLSELAHYDSGATEFDTSRSGWYLLLLMLVLGLVLSFTLSFVYSVSNVSIIQVIVVTWSVLCFQVLVRFWYRTYGLSGDINRPMSTVLLETTVYVLFVVVLFGWG